MESTICQGCGHDYAPFKYCNNCDYIPPQATNETYDPGTPLERALHTERYNSAELSKEVERLRARVAELEAAALHLDYCPVCSGVNRVWTAGKEQGYALCGCG